MASAYSSNDLHEGGLGKKSLYEHRMAQKEMQMVGYLCKTHKTSI
jgi:hypothetical protein